MRFFQMYLNSFRGLSREIWFLALVTFINRAGTMVVPFLSIYLKTSQHFSYEEIGWIMSAFGVGSMLGAWIGGKLTGKIGFYKVMYGSLFLSGVFFILLQYVHGLVPICLAVFFLMLVADTFRPASYVAINAYSSEENKTRSISLLRLAINLGFSFGPALGGMIIYRAGYSSLFWLDGITCILAGILFLFLLNERSGKQEEQVVIQKSDSPYRDYPYLLLMFIVFLVGFTFLQYFSTIPLYYKEVHLLSENQIGMLMFMNGFLIFLVEMPLIKFIEARQFSIYSILIISLVILSLSFVVLNLFSSSGILIVGMLFMTFGEMFNFPFVNSISLKRAKGKNTGDYMALFTMAFSLAHILGHNSGMQLVKTIGYYWTWYIMGGILLLCIALIFWYKNLTQHEEHELEKNDN
ncbi:MAG: transporter [Crocinitomicaceae bacterium]|jgi:predicted MFS family arabinose efflux permease|nr:transporter [Crocinitomicaceae bacterium]